MKFSRFVPALLWLAAGLALIWLGAWVMPDRSHWSHFAAYMTVSLLALVCAVGALFSLLNVGRS